jgi:squalene-associated FAD-dependent desaturase
MAANAARVAIVGGGLAGLAAAAALAERGVAAELFEARRKLGGRAGSYIDRATGQALDHCQHVAMGCCTNYLDFCRRTGVAALLRRYETLHFFGPRGNRSDFRPSRWLPAPLHLMGAFWRIPYLAWSDKLSIARAMGRLVARSTAAHGFESTILQWLQNQRQSPAAIERFWQVVLVSALGESLDRASLAAARKVFLDGFLAHRQASHLLVPRVALDELYDVRVADWLANRGATLHRETAVESVLGDAERAAGVRLTNGENRQFEFVLVAVPWRRAGELLPEGMRAAIDPQDGWAAIPAAPITSAHLWFDRPVTRLPHAVLIGRLAQWLFARELPGAPTEGSHPAPRGEHYYQVVISASHELAGRERQAIIDEVRADLAAVFPASAGAILRRWQLVTDAQAVFSMRPAIDALRPPQRTSIAGLLLAGDWTQTGWPATMEGAVRSGYLAAEELLRDLGCPEAIIVADLPQSFLVKACLALG